MVSDHISIRPRQRVLDPFQSHDQLDAGSRFWEDTEILLAANSKPPKLTPHPQRSELVLPVFRASSTETPRSRPESVTELCFANKYAFLETAVFRIVQEFLTNILAIQGAQWPRFGFPGLTPTFTLQQRHGLQYVLRAISNRRSSRTTGGTPGIAYPFARRPKNSPGESL
jgi:hypothetical protein